MGDNQIKCNEYFLKKVTPNVAVGFKGTCKNVSVTIRKLKIVMLSERCLCIDQKETEVSMLQEATVQ